ncbi:MULTISPECIES: deaminase domain-containing protein [unclassified Clostridium]|uniref:deaminase domain-containing protein n=1 Tax=unclassified Clostridium TaxID=2614128 RepID=UPI0025C407F3|nr:MULTISPECIES: deaminase domain-containing protein [unclassified Clostridium]
MAYSKINLVESKGSNISDFSYLKQENERLFTFYVEDKFPRFNDTKTKILEDIVSQIKDSNISGKINLYAELPACQSCTNMIFEFRRKFPNIKLSIFTGK